MMLTNQEVTTNDVVLVDASSTIILTSDFPEIKIKSTIFNKLKGTKDASAALKVLMLGFFAEGILARANRDSMGKVIPRCYAVHLL